MKPEIKNLCLHFAVERLIDINDEGLTPMEQYKMILDPQVPGSDFISHYVELTNPGYEYYSVDAFVEEIEDLADAMCRLIEKAKEHIF